MNYAVIGLNASNEPVVEFYEDKNEARSRGMGEMMRKYGTAYMFEQSSKMYEAIRTSLPKSPNRPAPETSVNMEWNAEWSANRKAELERALKAQSESK